ncbi:Cytochrome c, class IC [Aromatoleum aromaticum EbN1]|uniref:Cytochrome c, class IC n=2 Tax=Aromatoleum aromaticum TaxID=551760 RepID=Q5P1B8_AROAE|nr:c-type cytochrome [Aromatoleum aromaticum]CAI08896.1 Cytochrome c, class IC [Aromatoleum aromaticum EbN1]
MTRNITLPALAALALAGSPAHAGDPAAGKEKSMVCAACHGPDGNSPSPEFPRLGGQYEDYLYQALLDYKTGRRKNPIMAAQVENLSPADLGDLAAYFAAQTGLYQKR